MTATRTDSNLFTRQMLAGFARANEGLVIEVDGGFVLRSDSSGRVAVVVGGGSGHYPAFAGMVGEGLAAGAVCGGIFASPSSGQVFRVARQAESGAGILLSYGNYMGDSLNFSHAQEQLRAVGLDVRTVKVTDDVSSAPASRMGDRRGVAGDLFVFKIAGAAASRGFSLDDVERVAIQANQNIRTFGVAFSGCTLPGMNKPLFTIPTDKMALGLGVHGEPGVGEEDVPTPEGLARILVDQLWPETMSLNAKRVTVLLNGLGGMKYEELFSVYGFVHAILLERGLEVVAPEVGELVTSLEMSGCSLSIAVLDEELEALWLDPCNAPGFRRVAGSSHTRQLSKLDLGKDPEFREPVGEERWAVAVEQMFSTIEIALARAEEKLGQLDALSGDGDHGIGMVRGVRGAVSEIGKNSNWGVVGRIAAAGRGWSEAGGGTSGAIWGLYLSSIANSLSRGDVIDTQSVAGAINYATAQVQAVGGAKLGDKTLVDAMVPFANTLESQIIGGASLSDAWGTACSAAQLAADETSFLAPKIGRAKLHASRSVGNPDAGAVSFALIVSSIKDLIKSLGAS